jgi:hypothetical protein
MHAQVNLIKALDYFNQIEPTYGASVLSLKDTLG